MAKITPLRMTEEFEHFARDSSESFWGDVYRQTRLAWKRFGEAESIRERDSYMQTGWHDRVEWGERIDYRNGFYERDFVTRGNNSFADRPHAGQEFPAHRSGEVPAPSRGCADPDSGGFLARDLDAPSGTDCGDLHRRAGERADSFQARHRVRPGGLAVPHGGAARRMGLPVFGWRELTDAAAGGTKTRAHACSLCGEAGWNTSSVGVQRSSGESQQAWEGLLQNL